MGNFKDLDAYRLARSFSGRVYAITEHFPAEERFGLVSQMRRAGVSILANIAEGSGRKSDKDFVRFLKIALGSAYECEALLDIAFDLGFLEPGAYSEANDELASCRVKLQNLIRSLSGQVREENAPYEDRDYETSP